MFSPRGRSMIHLQRGPLSTIPPHRWHGGNSKPVLTHPHRDPGEHHLRVVHALNSPTGVVRISRWARKRGETGSTATRALARGAQPCLCDPPKATQFYRPRSPKPVLGPAPEAHREQANRQARSESVGAEFCHVERLCGVWTSDDSLNLICPPP
jgi:hypothetical protein